MTRPRKLILAAAGLIVLIGCFWWNDQPRNREGSSTGSKLSQIPESAPEASDPGTITELHLTLESLPKADAVALILRILDSGRDAVTGKQFKIGAGGSLIGAPTLRVWLLDRLGQLDTKAAAEYSQRIYERSGSADEWAVALRNDWRVAVQTGRIAQVRSRVLELLGDEAWARDPSLGFLEAFDVAVATMAWEAIPRFEGWVTSGKSKSLLNASWIALDRMAVESPTDFSSQLISNEEWLSTQPAIRAGLMARCSITVDAERSAVEAYLRRDNLGEAEARRFFEIFPNVSGTLSQTLVTQPRVISLVEAAQRDKAALDGIRDWLRRGEFSRWRDYMQVSEARLVEACASAVRGGVLNP